MVLVIYHMSEFFLFLVHYSGKCWYFYSFVKGVRLVSLPKQSFIHAFVAGRREPFADVVEFTFVCEKHVIARALFV